MKTKANEAKQNLLTQNDLDTYFRYDEENGKVFWKAKRGRSTRIGKEAGTIDNKGYRSIYFNKIPYLAHRLIWRIHYGEWPKNEIDHINRIPADNRIANLRVVTSLMNCQNRTISKNNTSGYPGVYWNKKNDNWYVSISIHNKQKCVGYFKTKDDAIEARKNAERNREIVYGG